MGQNQRKPTKLLEKLQGKMLKQIHVLNMPNSIPYAGILMEMGIWLVADKTDYLTLMYHHLIIN